MCYDVISILIQTFGVNHLTFENGGLLTPKLIYN